MTSTAADLPDGPRSATAFVQTVSKTVRGGGVDGWCVVEWTAPDGAGAHAQVHAWQRLDGFCAGDVLDVTVQAAPDRSLRHPFVSARRRVEVTNELADVVLFTVAGEGWEFGAVICGVREVAEPGQDAASA